jgi:hypothetical protein
MKCIKVKDEEHLVRDADTGFILNTDEEGYRKYLKKKQLLTAQKEKQRQQEEEINNLKKDVKEIKDLVLTLIEALNANK